MKKISLTVMEAVAEDCNNGIARFDTAYMDKIGVKENEIILIEGGTKTYAIAKNGYPGDVGMALIRLDSFSRYNAKAGIGDTIKVHNAKLNPAKKVIISSASQNTAVQVDIPLGVIKRGLIGRPFVKGDTFTTGEISRGKSSKLNQNTIFQDIFYILNGSLSRVDFGNIKFKVSGIIPKDGATVDYNTEIYLRKGKREKIKSKIEEFIELHLIPYESKLKSAENIKELTNLKNKVSKIKARVSPNALKTLDSYKLRIIKQIDKKISSLKK